MTPTLHALLIGIDLYENIRPLTGCEGDVKRMEQYLQDVRPEMPWNLELHRIVNHAANREAILTAFENLLFRRVQENDLVLVYFSGHGAQEVAGTIWKNAEYDGRLEGWAAQDSGPGEGHARLIADKELRYWFGKIGEKADRIISISDCCHSHDNHRSSQPEPPDSERNIPRRSEWILAERSFEDFCFADEITREEFASMPLEELMPMPRMVAMSACEAWEYAYESSGVGGVFTNYLLNMLRDSRGEVSYFDLQGQIAQRIQIDRPQYLQRPRAAVSAGDESDLFEFFLKPGSKGRGRILANLSPMTTRNTAENHFWMMDKGQIHGVKASSPDKPDSLVGVSLAEGDAAYLYVKEVETASSVVCVPSTDMAFTLLDADKMYRGYFPGLMQRALRLHLNGEPDLVNQFEKILADHQEGVEGAGLILQVKAEGADFGVRILRVNGNAYLIVTEVGNPRPLLMQTFCGVEVTEYAMSDLISQLRSLQTWSFARHLHNDRDNALDPELVSLRMGKVGETPDGGKEDEIMVVLEGDTPDSLIAKVQIILKNESQQSLFVGLLYLNPNGQVVSSLLRPSVAKLEPGAEIKALEGGNIMLKLDPHWRQFNYPEAWFFLQVIFSADPFTIEEFDQKGAQWPTLPWAPFRNLGAGLDFGQYEDEPPAGTWQARCYKIETPNPFFDPSGDYT